VSIISFVYCSTLGGALMKEVTNICTLNSKLPGCFLRRTQNSQKKLLRKKIRKEMLLLKIAFSYPSRKEIKV
jgi:hypothetical protein